MRLNAYLARAGLASRRKADDLIKAGKVSVNGRPGQLNHDIGPFDEVKVDGKTVDLQDHRYILLYKPAHVVSTLRDPQKRPTVVSIIEVKERVVPVGRLDTNTTGALLLTNDGDLAQKLMHPSFEVDKVYEAQIDGEITEGTIQQLENGVDIEGKRTAPASVRKLSAKKIELTIHEGRKHQVKKMLAAAGLTVKKLHRSRYGPLDLAGLKPGQWRELSEAEVERLKH